MEKRIFVFFVLSLVIWTSYLGLQLFLSPPPKKPAADGKQPLALKEKIPAKKTDDKETVDKEVDKASDKTVAEAKSSEDKTADDKVTNDKVADNKTAETKPKKSNKSKGAIGGRKLVTLGSLDPASGYTMLVTFDPQGAAINRIELNGLGPKSFTSDGNKAYHDLDDLSGYLGHLELTDEKNGCRVNLVGPGTPAAKAGLLVDDIITEINAISVRDSYAFTKYMQKQTKPEQTVQLTVLRGTGAGAKSSTISAKLIRRPLEIIRPEVNMGATALDPNQTLSAVAPASYRTTLTQADDFKLDLRDAEMPELASLFNQEWSVKVDPTAGIVEFETQVKYLDETRELKPDDKVDPLGLVVVKRFRLPSPEVTKPQYHLNLEMEFKNVGEQSRQVAYRLEGPNGLPIEGWWYTNKVGPGWGGVGARDVALFSDQHYLKGLPELITNADKQLKSNNPPTLDLLLGKQDRKFAYVAVDTQYFASGILPADVLTAEKGTLSKFAVNGAYALPLNRITDKRWNKTTNVSFFIDSEPTEIAAGKTHKASYLLFAGPKAPDVLQQYNLVALNEYGWFGSVSKTLLGVMKVLYWGTRNYGISIILLTVIVRMCLLPLGIKQAKSAALMQQLAPEIAKLKEKYANNLEEQAKAQRELFAKHNFNPMGGCFLMFFQLPIFIGLYRCLSVDIELREASLISGIQWCSNLAGPDELLRWKDWVWPYFSDEGNGWLGPYCNVLPLITIVLFVVQQKMFTPPATDEETKMQQNIMTFMTFFMGVLFYKVPAGLCIYFITSSLWGICERKLLPKPAPGAPTVPPPSTPDKTNDKDKADGGNSIWSTIFGFADAELKASKKHKRL